MTSIRVQKEVFDDSAQEPIFVNHWVLQALRIQIAILNARASHRSAEELEPLFSEVEKLLRDVVREIGAA